MAIKQIEENPNQDGLQLAKAGKTIGMVVTILLGSLLALYLLFIIGAMGLSFLEAIFQQ
jgi:tetrahydromethanopterin S-methyltransferase subunit G